MSRKGYHSYYGRGRSRQRALLFVLPALAILGVIAYFWIQPYIVYSADGVRIAFPWLNAKEEEPPTLDEDTLTILPPEEPEPSQPLETLPERNYDVLKDEAGVVYFSTNVRNAYDVQPQEKAHDTALLHVFLDDTFVTNQPNAGITTANGAAWTDANGAYWSSPTKALSWDYHRALLREVVELGYTELVLSSASYPYEGDFSTIPVGSMYNPTQLSAVLNLFYEQMAQVVPESITLSIWVPDAWLLGEEDGRSGLRAEDLLTHFDCIWYSADLQTQALQLLFGGDEALQAARGRAV